MHLHLCTVLEFIVHALINDLRCESRTDELVIVPIHNQVPNDEEVLKNVIVPRHYQIVELASGARGQGQDLVIVSRNNQSFDRRGNLYFVIMAIYGKVFNVVPHTLVLVMRIERVRPLRLCRGGLPVWCRTMSRGPMRLVMCPRWCLRVALVGMMVLVMTC